MAGVMFFGLIKTTSAGLIGIDLGSYAIKAVAISNIRGIYQVDAVANMLLPKGLIVDNHLQDISKISLVIRQLQKKLPVDYSNAAIAVTGADVMTKVMSINSTLNDLELQSQVEIEVENDIPFPLDEVFFDFEMLAVNEDDDSLNNILVSTARKESVLSHVQCVDEAGFKTNIVDIASHALARSVNYLLPIDNQQQSIAVVDIGASQMMLNIIHQGDIIFSRSKSHGGDVFTQMLVDRYCISFQDAEKLKSNAEFPGGCDIELLAPFIDQTIHYLQADLHMFANAFNHLQVRKIIVVGAGGLLPGFLKRLNNELNMEVIKLQYSKKLRFKKQGDSELFEQVGSQYMMALGLALRGAL